MSLKRVLYIEDNYQNRRLVKKLLKMNGYDFLEAEDGLQGIAVAARERPDLILMDINLPGIDGMEATSRLKSSSDLSEIPIIALTAAAMRGDRERIIAAGCDGYLQKPIDTDEVINTIRSHIGVSEHAAPVVAEAQPQVVNAEPVQVEVAQPQAVIVEVVQVEVVNAEVAPVETLPSQPTSTVEMPNSQADVLPSIISSVDA